MEEAPEHSQEESQRILGLSQEYEEDSKLLFNRMRSYWNEYFSSTPPEDLNVSLSS